MFVCYLVISDNIIIFAVFNLVVVMELKLIVCCHKEDIYKESDLYYPLHVGKSISKVNLNMQGDDVGDNISQKNYSYCELTGMYWAWKNLKNVDYIGFCHYRRYFDFNHVGRKVFPLTTISSEKFESLNLDVSCEAERWLRNGGCIVAKPTHLYTSLFLHYCGSHYSTDFKILGDVIRETLPPKYLKGFEDYLLKSNKFSPFNMFVMNWNQFDNYCNWLFPLLQAVEDRLNIGNYSPNQKRVYGYLGERLLNLYVRTNKLKTMEIPILKISDEPEVDNISLLKYYVRSFVRDIALKAIANSL